MTHDYTVIYQVVQDGWIMASVPELPGAITQAPTLDEARVLIQEAIEMLLEAYRDHGQQAARPTSST